jgi:hypothetical protein
MNNSEVRPCPFCGAQPVVWECDVKGSNKTGWRVGCFDFCRVHPVTVPYSSKEDAIAVWNIRKGETV